MRTMLEREYEFQVISNGFLTKDGKRYLATIEDIIGKLNLLEQGIRSEGAKVVKLSIKLEEVSR